MRRGAIAGRRHADFAGIGLGVGDEVGNGFGWNRWVYHHNVGASADARDRRNVADEIVSEVVVERPVDRVAETAQEKRVAVGRRTYNRLGTNIAAAACPIVDNKLLPEAL